MSKYQDIMSHVQVDDEMKKRILQNVEKEAFKESDDGRVREEEKVTKAPQKKVVNFRRYAAIAATFAVLLVGSYAVIQMTGDVKNTATTMSDSSYAPAATAEPEMSSEAEAPAMEAAVEEAAEEPAMDAFGEEAAETPDAENDMMVASPATEAAGATETAGLAESAKSANEAKLDSNAADITIKFENSVALGDVWIIENTQENMKSSDWGTATLSGAAKDKEYSLVIPQNADGSYLVRMTDTDGNSYTSGKITLKEGYSISIFLEGEFDDVRMVIRDENGEIVGDEILFNAAL